MKSILDDTVHLEIARGKPAQNKAYCTKEETRVAGPWEGGNLPSGQGHRQDLIDFAREIKDNGLRVAALANPVEYLRYASGAKAYAHALDRETPRDATDLKVTLILGNPGLGKTRRVYRACDWRDLYIHDADSRWFDGYMGENVVLMDDFSGKASGMRLVNLLRLIDRYDVRLEVKGSFTYLRAKHIVLTSNLHPYSWYEWKGRGLQYWALMRRFHRIVVMGDDHRHHDVEGAELARFEGGEYGPMPGSDFWGWKVEPSAEEPARVGPKPPPWEDIGVDYDDFTL